jgi:hypothetical protein
MMVGERGDPLDALELNANKRFGQSLLIHILLYFRRTEDSSSVSSRVGYTEKGIGGQLIKVVIFSSRMLQVNKSLVTFSIIKVVRRS